jgi:hypothetical protein
VGPAKQTPIVNAVIAQHPDVIVLDSDRSGAMVRCQAAI